MCMYVYVCICMAFQHSGDRNEGFDPEERVNWHRGNYVCVYVCMYVCMCMAFQHTAVIEMMSLIA